MQIIDELEPDKRGSYGGAIGYLSTRRPRHAIHIRTVVVKDGCVHVQAGGGTVADAKPDYEYDESVTKAKAIFRPSSWPRAAGVADEGALSSTTTTRFTYNLVQYLGELGRRSRWSRTTGDRRRAARRGADRLVISPGPCTPAEAGISSRRRGLSRGRDADAGRLPRPPVAGRGVRRRRVRGEPIHGKDAEVEHDGRAIFAASEAASRGPLPLAGRRPDLPASSSSTPRATAP
jgi:hypothetical protein